MSQVWEGKLIGTGTKIAIVVSRFNAFITDKLLEGALDTLKRHGVAETDISIALVPGAFELPLIAKKMALPEIGAVICLGALIRGSTPHFDYIAAATASGISSVGLETGVPVIFGVLTCETVEQAIERSGTKAGNKGSEAALAAIEMANLMRGLPSS